jgi:hypothetical protein
MAKIPTVVPVADLEQDAARVLEGVRASEGPVFLDEGGRTTAVLVSFDAYRKAEADRELLLMLARGERDIAAGVGASLDSVLAEADALLADR